MGLAALARPPVRRENSRRWSLRGLTPTVLGAAEPVHKYGAGTCGAFDCCLEREYQTHLGRPPPGNGICVRPSGRFLMEVYAERSAGLDVHRDNVVATVRVRSEEGRRV